jgi:hypothetical protein
MHGLEHVLFVAALALEKDEIGKAELVRELRNLAGWSGNYIPENGEEPLPVLELNREWSTRFEHILHPGGMTEGEDDGLANR